MGGTLYTSWEDALGVSHIDEPVAVFENGKIYTAADGLLGTTEKGVLIGEYEGGIVYTVGTGTFNNGKRLNAVAVIEYGQIYSISKSMFGGISKSLSVGACSCGKVYSHSHKFMEDSEPFGLYNGDEEGAAAAAAIALFKLESDVSAYAPELNEEESSSRPSSSSDEERGWFGDMIAFYAWIFKAIGFVCVIGFKLIAWIVGLIKKGIQNHKERKAHEEMERAEEVPETLETETEMSTYTDASVDTDVVVDTSIEDTTTDIPESAETPDVEKEIVAEIPDKAEKETGDISSETKEGTEPAGETPPTSRLISTMRTTTTETSIEESDGFKSAGDL